ncbi:hypothetical protein KAR91_77035 [Candidatus Pacearchaeota archaeon]|nr:hypothetical protein [Candidatus Pacearchaeota archaeon]
MSRKKAKSPPFAMIRLDLLRDPEWRKLSNSAKVVYIHLRAKFNCKTLSEVTLTYSEMKDMMSSRTLSKAFKELIKGKWIEKVKFGGLYGGACVYKFIGKYKDFYYKGFKV